MLAWVSPQSRGRKSSKPVRRQASSRIASSASRLREPEFRDGRDAIVKNLAPLADVAAVPSAYDAEALVSVLVGHLIQAGTPEQGLTRMMLDVIDELRRRDADHSYPALRALAVIGPPGVAEYAAVAAGRLAAGMRACRGPPASATSPRARATWPLTPQATPPSSPVSSPTSTEASRTRCGLS